MGIMEEKRETAIVYWGGGPYKKNSRYGGRRSWTIWTPSFNTRILETLNPKP